MANLNTYIKGVNVEELTKIIDTMNSISSEAKTLIADNGLQDTTINGSGPVASGLKNAYTELVKYSETFAMLSEVTGSFLRNVLDAFNGADNAMSRAIKDA